MRRQPPRRPTRKPLGDRLEILFQADWRCFFCGERVDEASPAQVAFLQPPSKGGKPVRSNLCAACPSCASKKAGRTLEEYRIWSRRDLYPSANLAHRLRKEIAKTPTLTEDVLQQLLAVVQQLDDRAPRIVFYGETVQDDTHRAAENEE